MTVLPWDNDCPDGETAAMEAVPERTRAAEIATERGLILKIVLPMVIHPEHHPFIIGPPIQGWQ